MPEDENFEQNIVTIDDIAEQEIMERDDDVENVILDNSTAKGLDYLYDF